MYLSHLMILFKILLTLKVTDSQARGMNARLNQILSIIQR